MSAARDARGPCRTPVRRPRAPPATQGYGLVQAGELERAARRLPEEQPYPVADEALAHLRA